MKRVLLAAAIMIVVGVVAFAVYTKTDVEVGAPEATAGTAEMSSQCSSQCGANCGATEASAATVVSFEGDEECCPGGKKCDPGNCPPECIEKCKAAGCSPECIEKCKAGECPPECMEKCKAGECPPDCCKAEKGTSI